MIPFKLAQSSYATNLSPSITVERGAYRMRAPYAKPVGKTLFSSAATPNRQTERPTPLLMSNLAMLVLILAFASISCFGMAYYLFVTRWDARASSVRPSANQHLQVVPVDSDPSQVLDRPDEKFLAYLPHSGFHNQRIAFENSLLLARLLNRTLLAPPIRLASTPLHYLNFDALYHTLALSNKLGLRHCSQVPLHIPLPLECADYSEYTHISWNWLMNLTEVKRQQRIFQRWNMTHAWIQDRLGVTDADTLTIKDSSIYQYRFLDTIADVSPPDHKFLESLYIPHLATCTKRLIQVGTLFGSSRLRLKDRTNVSWRSTIRQSMSFSNPMLVDAARSIAQSLGFQYLGIHLRVTDGQFRTLRKRNVRTVWQNVMHVLKYSPEQVESLERIFHNQSKVTALADFGGTGVDLSLARRQQPRAHGMRCREPIYVDPGLVRLNIPLYISTDAQESEKSMLFSIFHKTFPCIFYASDFPGAVAPLMNIRNADDDVPLGKFFLPFLDAMVLGYAKTVFGTDGSTFSRFVQDVLWTTYHGEAVMERG